MTIQPRGLLRRTLFCQTALAALIFAAPQLYAQDSEEVIDLIPIIVQNKLAYSGQVDGYLANASETGVKAGVPLAEVPQSITVVTSTELAERAPRQVEDTVSYVAGIHSANWGADDRYDQFSMRGFDMGPNSLYRDGLPQKLLNFSGFVTDPYMIERIDVLRGPAGVLYGSNDAGGMVNLVTKRPVFERLAESVVTYNSTGTASAGFDIGNVLNDSGTLAGRLTGLVRDGETAYDNSANDRTFVAGGLTWAPTDNTSLTFLAHYQKDSLTPLLFSPVNGEDIDASWGVLPDSFAYAQSPYNHFDTEQTSFGTELTHAFSQELVFNQRFRMAKQTTDYAQLDFSYADASGLHYYAFENDETARTLGLDNNLQWTSAIGGAENTLTFGADMQRSEFDSLQYLDYTMYDVSYADPSLDFAVTQPALGTDQHSEYLEQGVYLQDHLRLETGTTITAGVRHSWFDTEVTNNTAGTVTAQSNDATTAMIGATHQLANGLTPYASYTEGFIQNVGKTITGDVLDPSESFQKEIGLRYAPTNNLLLALAVFDLRKTNVKEYDLNDATWTSFTQAGEVRSRGIELEARGRLTDTLSGVASYTYLDAEITKSTDTSIIGNASAFAPEHQASIWVDYDASAHLAGLTLGGGVRYVSDFYASQNNGRVTEGFTLVDAKASFDVAEVTVNVGVTNLLDTEYYGNCYDGYGCSLGEGRTLTVSLSQSF